jgi:asparagine synthase (glutamine-hydrolysing)
MCGIAGFTIPRGLSAHERRERFERPLQKMTSSLSHRGPDAQDHVLLDGAALGHTRLAIVDTQNGRQPMVHAPTGVALVFNGEIFNHVELRARLSSRHAFRTRSDTEVLLAAYLDRGAACVDDFVGQFAFAIYDPRDASLLLARDHTGIQPLFYVHDEAGLSFASEVKALFAGERIMPAFDPRGLRQTFTLWTPIAPRTPFYGVRTLEPGTTATFRDHRLAHHRYWSLDTDIPASGRIEDPTTAARTLHDVLDDAVRLRLRADVPVGAYLSGGLDSSVVCALAQRHLGGELYTFSLSFSDGAFDEVVFQREVAAALRTNHKSIRVDDHELARVLPTVVRQAEQPLLRAAPAPLFLLSRLVRDSGLKVVLTGEGADEFLLGYDIYKETRVRQFWARQPSSTLRPRLLRRLYPYLPFERQGDAVLRAVFGAGLESPHQAGFSHRIRWEAGARIARFFSAEFAAETIDFDPVADVLQAMPEGVRRTSPLQQAQWLEVNTLLSGYLLSAQGDRMLMGNAVEGRFPFLDHRVIAVAQRIPERLRLRGLDEKFILKRAARGLVPEAVLRRPKFPYRAPAPLSLVGDDAPAWARDALSIDAVDAVGVFDGHKVARLIDKLRARDATRAAPSESDSMALMAIASTQLLANTVLAARPPASMSTPTASTTSTTTTATHRTGMWS